jgi:hypothetical protein
MGTRTICLGLLLTAAMALAPAPAWCQVDSGGQDLDYAPPDPVFPFPLGSDRPERGGMFVEGSFKLWRQTNPLKSQVIAVRGFNDTNGAVQDTLNFLTDFFDNNPGPPVVPGKFFGSGAVALDVNQVSGPNSYQPGFGTMIGWRFENGVAVELDWTHLLNKKLSATAAPVGPTLNGGQGGADLFLFAPVYNWPLNYVGPVNKIIVSLNTPGIFMHNPPVAPNGTTIMNNPVGFVFDKAFLTAQGSLGIWNAAQLMTIQFVQRYDEFDLIGRIPIYESPRCRAYGVFGGRHVQLWEGFTWRTVDLQVALITARVTGAPPVFEQTFNLATAGVGDPQDQATYSNVVSNRLYGPVAGCGTDLYLGHGLAVAFELRGAPLLDVVKERAKYELGDKSTAASRNRTDYTLAYELDAKASLNWFPVEAVELHLGYDVMNFFNTVSSPHPIDFNFGSLTPTWEKGTYRLIDGIEASIILHF